VLQLNDVDTTYIDIFVVEIEARRELRRLEDYLLGGYLEMLQLLSDQPGA
jgi:hypothetical protein